MNAQGLPTTWEHFQVGVRALAQMDHRGSLRTYDAVNLAMNGKADDRKAWVADMKRGGGLC